MKQVEVGGGWLAVEEAGSGPPALFIHGFPLTSALWRHQLAGLGHRRRCLAPDLRGHGASPYRGDVVHSVELLASDLVELLEQEAPEGADIVALSMGGYVALALCEARPDLVRTVALCSSRTTADSPEAKETRQETARRVVDQGRGWLAEQMLPTLLAEEAGLEVRAAVRTMIESVPYQTLVADLYGMRERPDRTRVLAGLAAPVLVMVGDQDRITPPETARATAEMARGARLRVIPGAGHLVPLESPDECNRELAAFWESAG